MCHPCLLRFCPFPNGSGRAEKLSEMLASVRRQGIRAESLLKDSDNLIQRYRNLKIRVQKQAEVQSALEGEYAGFISQAGSTRTWITDLLQPLISPVKDTQTEEVKSKVKVSMQSISITLYTVAFKDGKTLVPAQNVFACFLYDFRLS